jgi:cation transport ATPase
MALGSWRLKGRRNSQKIRTVESFAIICTDKTGTLTENSPSKSVYALAATNYTKRAMEYGRGKKSH